MVRFYLSIRVDEDGPRPGWIIDGGLHGSSEFLGSLGNDFDDCTARFIDCFAGNGVGYSIDAN
jgi:hypothetical protein